MADRTIAPLGDAFLVWTAVIASLTAQLLLTMLGLGAGIDAVGYAIDRRMPPGRRCCGGRRAAFSPPASAAR